MESALVRYHVSRAIVLHHAQSVQDLRAKGVQESVASLFLALQQHPALSTTLFALWLSARSLFAFDKFGPVLLQCPLNADCGRVIKESTLRRHEASKVDPRVRVGGFHSSQDVASGTCAED